MSATETIDLTLLESDTEPVTSNTTEDDIPDIFSLIESHIPKSTEQIPAIAGRRSHNTTFGKLRILMVASKLPEVPMETASSGMEFVTLPSEGILRKKTSARKTTHSKLYGCRWGVKLI
jgi:hypothetical protein